MSPYESRIPADAVEGKRPFRLKLDDQRELVLVRSGELVIALQGQCPHAGAKLADGAICGQRLVCPWHKASFAVGDPAREDGALLEPPAVSGLVRYPVRREGDTLVIGHEALAPAGRPPEVLREPDSGPPGCGAQPVLAVIGTGAAGAAAVACLRESGFAGRVLLIGDETPYDRTSLSKFGLSGQMPPEQVPPLLEPAFYEEHRIERVAGRVELLDVAERRLRLAGGDTLAYDQALLCPGGAPVRPALPGVELAGVLTLRNLDDQRAILAASQDGGTVVIVGGSFIGLEAASALRERDVKVSVVMRQPVPLRRQVGEAAGRALRTLHEQAGVRFHAGALAAIEGGDRVRAVRLDSGERIETGLVLLATGVRPATGFVRGLALAADGAVEVDRAMRAAPGLYAAGDVAAFPAGDGRVRIEHWRVAQQQARIAARNMAGLASVWEATPYFWTYHYGKRFEVLGHPAAWDAAELDGDPERGDFIARLSRAGQLVGVVACGRERDTAALEPLLRI